MKIAERWRSWAPYLRSVLRFILGLMFVEAGSAKLFAFPGAVIPGGGTVPLASLGGVGSVLEFVGGWLLLLGLFTRPAAFILSGQMAVAYFGFHAPNGFWPVLNGGGPAIYYCFTFLYLSAAGGGPWSLDAKLRGNRGGSTG
jgi:putative oxidoreductase